MSPSSIYKIHLVHQVLRYQRDRTVIRVVRIKCDALSSLLALWYHIVAVLTYSSYMLIPFSATKLTRYTVPLHSELLLTVIGHQLHKTILNELGLLTI